MSRVAYADARCQASPIRQGTILHCLHDDCHARWRFQPRSPTAQAEDLEMLRDFGSAMSVGERNQMLRSCRIPRCPNCFRLSGTPATDQPPADLDLGEVRGILEDAGFVRQESEPTAIAVAATFPLRERWEFAGAAGKVTDTTTAPGGIDISPDKLPEEPRTAQAPRLVVVAFRALYIDPVEALRSPIGWIKVMKSPGVGEPHTWPMDRVSLASDLKMARAWAVPPGRLTSCLRRAAAWLS